VKKSKLLKKLTALIVICILWLSVSYSQNILEDYYISIGDCGHWEADSNYTTEWIVKDTINFCDKCDPEWTYSEWKNETSNMTLTVYCPCGCGHDTIKTQRRINDRGIIQIRYDVTTYKYYPKPKTDYQRKLESIKNR